MSIESGERVTNREACLAMDLHDPLRHLRERFRLPPRLVYLDGNSLGPPAVDVRRAVTRAVEAEWGEYLIAGWERAGWLDAPERIGDKIARLIGAAAGETVVTDSTSVNLFKLLAAGMAQMPSRRVILTEEGNFPTDVYVAQRLCDSLGGGMQLRTVPREALTDALTEDVGVVMLTHVDYRTGFRHDMAAITSAAHRAGALMLWDLCHSVGAVPLDMRGCDADLAVGCGYKFLNGGPGAPAFLFVAGRLQSRLASPIAGWMGHADTFRFGPVYEPAEGVRRFLAGTPGVVGLAALEAAVDLWLEADLGHVYAKSQALSNLLIQLVEDRCSVFGLELLTPRDPDGRGSQVSLRHRNGYAVVRALASRQVVCDFRPPDVVRLGITPLYLRYADVWDAVEALSEVLHSELHLDPQFGQPQRIP